MMKMRIVMRHNMRWWRWFVIVTGHLTCANRLTGKPIASKVMTLGSNPSLRDHFYVFRACT